MGKATTLEHFASAQGAETGAAKGAVFKKDFGIFSFFAGAGFLDLGFEADGFDILYVNEFYPAFLHAYKHSRKQLGSKEPIFGYFQGDVTGLSRGGGSPALNSLVAKARKEYRFIGFVGGPPCTDFSVGGKNRGGKGDHGKLSSVYASIIVQQQPDFFVFENVKGLLKTARHRKFYNRIKSALKKGGYVTTEQLVNALEFGVPQDRERVILIGFKKALLSNAHVQKDSGFDTIFPWGKFKKHTKDEVFKTAWPRTGVFKEKSSIWPPMGIPLDLTAEFWFKKNKVSAHPNARHFFTPKSFRFKTVQEGDDSKKSFKRLHRWRYSPTCCYGNNEVHLHPYLPRRISVAEALALQSLPASFSLPADMTLTDMFKAIGNGVPFLVASSIARSIRDFLSGISLSRRG